MKVLVIAPHPDDETLGCGGAILDHISKGDSVQVVFLTSGELGIKSMPAEEAKALREQEAQAATMVLGTTGNSFLRLPDWGCLESTDAGGEALALALQTWKPSLVYLPHEEEDHPDHQAALPILRAACQTLRALGHGVPDALLYEVWSPMTWFDHVIDITAFMETKLRAMRCHNSQLEKFRFDRAVEGLNRYRGEIAGKCDYAEVFQTSQL